MHVHNITTGSIVESAGYPMPTIAYLDMAEFGGSLYMTFSTVDNVYFAMFDSGDFVFNAIEGRDVTLLAGSHKHPRMTA